MSSTWIPWNWIAGLDTRQLLRQLDRWVGYTPALRQLDRWVGYTPATSTTGSLGWIHASYFDNWTLDTWTTGFSLSHCLSTSLSLSLSLRRQYSSSSVSLLRPSPPSLISQAVHFKLQLFRSRRITSPSGRPDVQLVAWTIITRFLS